MFVNMPNVTIVAVNSADCVNRVQRRTFPVRNANVAVELVNGMSHQNERRNENDSEKPIPNPTGKDRTMFAKSDDKGFKQEMKKQKAAVQKLHAIQKR